MKSAVKEGEERGSEEREREEKERERREGGRSKRGGGREEREEREGGRIEEREESQNHYWAQNHVHHIITTRHTFYAPPIPDHNTRNKSGYSDHFSLTKVKVSSGCILLCKRAAILFQFLAVSLNVLHHEVLPGQFIVVGEVTNHPAACTHTDTRTDAHKQAGQSHNVTLFELSYHYAVFAVLQRNGMTS